MFSNHRKQSSLSLSGFGNSFPNLIQCSPCGHPVLESLLQALQQPCFVVTMIRRCKNIVLFRRFLQNKTELFHYESTGKLFDCPKIAKIDTAATLAFLQNLFIDIVQMLLRVPDTQVVSMDHMFWTPTKKLYEMHLIYVIFCAAKAIIE